MAEQTTESPNRFATLGVSGATFQGLETFDLPDTVDSVNYRSDEVMALCPVTGQPDYYVVDIALRAVAKGLETKSLKLYLGTYRERGIFCEMLADAIAKDVVAVTAGTVEVEVKQKSRGGIQTNALAFVMNIDVVQSVGDAGCGA